MAAAAPDKMSAPKRRKAVVETWRPARYDCCHCRRDVRGETHLRPVDEEKEELALCTDCYSVGRTGAFGYKWTADAVRVIDTAATGRPLLVEDWLADQEVRLLDGILQYGFGNWRAVAEHMGGDKTEQMCEEHYETFYLRSKTFPLPDLSGPPKKPAAPAETKQAGAGLGDTDAASSTVPKEKRGASGMIIDGNQVAPADLVGYMPLRGEYDTEWEVCFSLLRRRVASLVVGGGEHLCQHPEPPLLSSVSSCLLPPPAPSTSATVRPRPEYPARRTTPSWPYASSKCRPPRRPRSTSATCSCSSRTIGSLGSGSAGAISSRSTTSSSVRRGTTGWTGG